MYTKGTIRILPDKVKVMIFFFYSVVVCYGIHLMNGGDMTSFMTFSNLLYPEIFTAFYALLIMGVNTIKELREEKDD